MRIPCTALKAVSNFRPSAIQNAWFGFQQKNYSFDAIPVRLAFDVYNAAGTNLKLPPVVIMHGLFGTKQNWRTVAKNLNKITKRKIYALDARNHGDSPHSPVHSSEAMALDVAKLLKTENIKRASFIGHSMGGRTMMAVTLKFPELVEKTIIVDISPISMPRTSDHMKEIFRAMKAINVPKNLSLAEARPIVHKELKKAVGEADTVDFIMLNLRKRPTGEFEWRMAVDNLYQTFDHWRRSYSFELPPFKGPVLFIGAKYSHFLPPEDWPKIQEIFPNSKIKWMECGHLIHFEQPQDFIETVSKFIGS